MRHRKAGKKLGRTWEHRKAMFRSMARSLLTHGRIRTTEAKAKELRKLADRLISFGLENDLHARRKAYKVLENHGLVKRLFDEIAPRYVDVPGGYTRVVKLGLPRRGDAASMAIIELTEPKAAAATEKPAEKSTKEAAKKTAKPEAEKQPKEAVKTEEDSDAKQSAATEKAEPVVEETESATEEKVQSEEPAAEPEVSEAESSDAAEAEPAPEEDAKDPDESEEKK